jgi:hypothetical protein
MRLISVLSAALILGFCLPGPGAGQEAAPPEAGPATPPPPDWTAGKGATASIDVIGPGGKSLRHTYGVVLGDPGRVVLRLTDLAGAEKAVASFRDGTKVESMAVYSTDPIQDIAVLETKEPLPAPPDPATAIKWRSNAKVVVLPGADMGEESEQQTVTEPFEQGKVRVIPLSGELPSGLAVMDVQGKWIGLTGRIDDSSGKFAYLTSSEQIIPVLFGPAAGMPISQLGVAPPDWQNAREATGMLVRGILRGFQKPAEAGPYFDLALQRDPTMPEIHFWIGKNAFRQQKYVDAEAGFREAIRLKPDYGLAYHMAGAAANQQGHYDVALELYEQGLKVNPNNSMTMTNKAGALYNLGRVPESIEVLKKAIALDPANGLAVHNLGVTYSTLGNRTEAEAMYQKLVLIDKYLAKGLRDRLDGK